MKSATPPTEEQMKQIEDASRDAGIAVAKLSREEKNALEEAARSLGRKKYITLGDYRERKACTLSFCSGVFMGFAIGSFPIMFITGNPYWFIVYAIFVVIGKFLHEQLPLKK